MKAVVKEFHHEVRIWFSEIPLDTNLHTALDVLHFALHLTDGQLNRTIDDRKRDHSMDFYRGDVDCEK